MTVRGFDVSHHQGDVNMHEARVTGHMDFVGIKMTEGLGYVDARGRLNRDKARAEGLVRLLYHFASTNDPVREADFFCNQIGTLEPGEIAILDEESTKAVGDRSQWVLKFLARVDERTGRKGGVPDDDAELYTYGPYANAHLRLRTLAGKKLWLAAYSSSPRVPAPWKSWTFWQYSSSGSVPGIAGRVDLNYFSGPYEALQRLAGVQTAPIDTEEERMFVSGAPSWGNRQPNGRFPRFVAMKEANGNCSVASVDNAAFEPAHSVGNHDKYEDFIWQELWWRRFFDAGSPTGMGEADDSFFLIAEHGTYDLAKKS